MALNFSMEAGTRISIAAAAAAGFPLPSRRAALNVLAVVTNFATMQSADMRIVRVVRPREFFTYHLVDDVWQ
jgi:hypothetical protein